MSSGGSSIIIAVLDSGVDPAHPDLAPVLLNGWNFYDNNDNWADLTGHGTAVAGVAGAVTNNAIGVASISWACAILPVKVTNPSGYAYYSTLSKGLVYAADRGAKLAVISFEINGGSSLSSAAKYFVDKGGLVFASGGNSGVYVSDPDNPYIVSVSGTTGSDVNWGSYGPYIDLSAPSSGIYTTIKGGGYGFVGGTSFSAPLAAGLAALVFAKGPSLSPLQVEQVLESTAVDLGEAGYDYYYGWGRISASQALSSTVGSAPFVPILDTTPPTIVIDTPADGAVVSGCVAIKATARDDVAVSKVEFYLDGTLYSADASAPYEAVLDTTLLSSGVHGLSAKAVDSSGNIGETKVQTINVENSGPEESLDTVPPTVSITKPRNGARVTETISIVVSASDASGIKSVEILIDNNLVCTLNVEPFVYSWNTKMASNGLHVITAKALDLCGNSGQASISVNVANKIK